MKWGQSFRIRHITTGRYLCLDEEKGLLVVDPERANTKQSAFCFRVSKVRINDLIGPLRYFAPGVLHYSSIFFFPHFGLHFCLSCWLFWAGEGGCGSEAWRWGNGHSGDKVWRVHVLCPACIHRPVADICLPGCQSCSFRNDEEKGLIHCLVS